MLLPCRGVPFYAKAQIIYVGYVGDNAARNSKARIPMAYSASRMTLYAVLSAIEDDLREIIQDHLAAHMSPTALLGPDLFEKAHRRLLKEQGVEYAAPTVVEILPYVDYADSFELLNRHSKMLPDNIAKYIKSVTPRLELATPIRNRVSHGRPLNFDDLATVLEVADALASANAPLWCTLIETRKRLNADPSFVLGLTIPKYESEESDKKHNLPQPDFDETGFLGREQQVGDVIRLCLGPYPVITLSGEGGIGKTALALKVAYDLLDLPACPFEAVVWASSKTTALTAHEITRIKGAISDSLGVFQSVALELGGKSAEDPITEVLSYLKEFKILLILDNLETVLDDNIRTFLQRMPTGSKILITSRIGLGAFEFPFKVPSLQRGESVQLLRALAKTRGLQDLVRIPAKTLEMYCAGMQNNPGWIKWFISAVQAGRRPEEIIEKSDVFLDFCMSNVYEFLTTESRAVLAAMITVPGSHSQAELAFLSGLDALELQKCLQLLLTTNFIVMNSVPAGSSFESKYGISELGREFLQKHHPPSKEEHLEVIKRKRQLIAAGEQIKIEEKANPFSFQSIVTRSTSDLIVARYLLDALSAPDRGGFAVADKAIQTAKNLAPNFFEVHRVEAQVRVAQGNYSAARDAYERAVEYEPGSAPLRLWFGNFLMRYVDDLEGALIQLKEASRLAPEAPEIKFELARVHIYQSDFGSAKIYIDSLLKQISHLSEWNRRKLYDMILTFHQRKADHNQAQHNFATALEDLEGLQNSFKAIPARSLDSRMCQKAKKAIVAARSCQQNLVDPVFSSRCQSIISWIEELEYRNSTQIGSGTGWDKAGSAIHSGRVSELVAAKGYGFIQVGDGKKLFFHREGLAVKADWNNLSVGTAVKYRKGSDDKGRALAVGVEVVLVGALPSR